MRQLTGLYNDFGCGHHSGQLTCFRQKKRELENNSFENCAAPLHEQWQILDIIVADNYVLHLHTCRIFLKQEGIFHSFLQTMKSKIYRTLHLTIAHYCMNNGGYQILLQQISKYSAHGPSMMYSLKPLETCCKQLVYFAGNSPQQLSGRSPAVHQ